MDCDLCVTEPADYFHVPTLFGTCCLCTECAAMYLRRPVRRTRRAEPLPATPLLTQLSIESHSHEKCN